MPEVMMGVMPSSMSVPRFDARMTRIQYSGSAAGEKGSPSALHAWQRDVLAIVPERVRT